MLLWETNEDKIPEARKILWDAGRIFDYHKYLDGTPMLTGDELLAHTLKMMGHDDPATAIVLDGQGNEIPTEEVRQRIKSAKKSHPTKKDAKKK